MQPFTSQFVPSHKQENVYLAVIWHLHHWLNDADILRATAVTRGPNECPNESAHKVDPGEENSPAAPVGNRISSLSITK